MEPTRNQALERAIDAAGGLTALARLLGLKSHAVIHQWRLNRVPAEHCPSVEGATGVRCEELRPDVNWGVLRASVGAAPAAPDTASAQAAEDGVVNG
jgi:DNA-binding transcriptional regulator YdaS (Cro superfamily)